jgi:hypothetical protein
VRLLSVSIRSPLLSVVQLLVERMSNQDLLKLNC